MDWGRHRSLLKKSIPLLTIVFMLLVAVLLYDSLSQVNWQEVTQAVTKLSASTLLLVLALSFLNYFLYSLYDYMSFRFLHLTDLSALRIFMSAAVCYAFNLNLGALVGGMGLRYKIYAGWKVKKSKLPWIPVISAVTSWLGYLLLLALLFLFRSQEVAAWVPLGPTGVKALGVIAMSAIGFYFVLCWRGKKVKLKHHKFKLPHVSGALLQFAVSSVQWCLPSVIIWVLMGTLGGNVSYEQVLFTHLMAGVIGVITHIPGGLGVLETIFLRSPFNMPASQILVALLCFRAVYYFLPLLLALPGYLFIEIYQNRRVKRSFFLNS